jgi:hypothetical protein
MDESSNISMFGDDHAACFKQTLARLLSTEVAETTYSEILDGLPTIDSFREFHFRQKEHPVDVLDHASLCPGVAERTRQFRQDFDPAQLQLSPTVSFALKQLAPACQRVGLRLTYPNLLPAALCVSADPSKHTTVRVTTH